ncbi:hypothetical protein AMATHDRAFT_135953, partial [Amanita thiersii Skay4041]
DVADVYRTVFKFGVFNAVQSSCFDRVRAIPRINHSFYEFPLKVYLSDENIVIMFTLFSKFPLIISAPTGSGKTVLFELAIIRLLRQAKDIGKGFKCVYISPTKALCSERFRDWDGKFGPLGIKCCELTGDTVYFGKGAWDDARNASVMSVGFAEKWDSLTRTWRDHEQILSQIKLFLVDEVVHILSESRGSTLEVVVSRMKINGSAVRFILVSATVPNIRDVADWIGTNGSVSHPAMVLEEGFFDFGEEYRPCKLTRVVVGVPRSKHQNDFSFAKVLDGKLFATLQAYSVGKPVLVFCPTRNGVFSTAEQLKKEFLEAEKKRDSLPWLRPKQYAVSLVTVHFIDFSELACLGIGVHHAGLTMEDRRSVEDLFMKGIIRIVIATSTLAVGINLPAHTVVIKGVHMYQNSTNVEYSDLDIMQMMGRAGRPQFDTEGLAIILCESGLEGKYRALVQGTTIIESSLHRNLAEHLNSEVGLGTIASVKSAKDWLRSSFLFQRIRKNPSYYALDKADNQTWEERMDDIVVQSFAILADMKLIEYKGNGTEVRSTEYGDIMSKVYELTSPMDLILRLPDRLTLREVVSSWTMTVIPPQLEAISSAEESVKELETKSLTLRLQSLNKLRVHHDIRYDIKRLEKTADKVFIIIQAILGGIPLNSPEYRTGDTQPHLEALAIFRHVCRIVRAIVEVGIVKKCGAQMKYGLELLRCLSAKAWEDRPVVLRQIEQIGEKSHKCPQVLQVLAENGINTLQALRGQEAHKLEMLLNRRPPFGQEVLASVLDLPQYSLEVKELCISTNQHGGPVQVELSIHCSLMDSQRNLHLNRMKRREASMTVIYTITSDMEFIDFRRIPTKALKDLRSFTIVAQLTKPSQYILITMSAETIAGIVVSKTYKPEIAPEEFPVPDTRPPIKPVFACAIFIS